MCGTIGLSSRLKTLTASLVRVLIASLAGKVAAPKISIYAATKFGLRGSATPCEPSCVGPGSACR